MPCLLVSLALAIGAPIPKAPAAKKAEPATPVGEWVYDAMVIDGRAVPVRERSVHGFTPDGKMFGRKGKEAVPAGVYAADPTKGPAEIDLTFSQGKGMM